MIKKKYNLNHHVSTVTTPKLTDMWKKKQTDGISSKTPLKTNNSSSLSQTKSSPLNSTINKSPSSSFTSNSVTLGTNGNHYSINNLLGQLHKENMERRRQLSGKNDHSMIGHETKNKFDKNHVERKLVYVDLTESPSPQPVSKNNQNTTLISKKANFPVKTITQDSEQKSLPKISQSSIRDFSKPLKDRNLYESKRSFLSSNVNFIEKNMELSFKSIDKHEKSHHSNICVSPKKKHSYASESFHKKNTSLLSTSTDSSSDNSGNISSPQSNKSSFLTKKDTTASLLLLKKKRKRLLDSSTDPSPDKQKSSSKFENQSISNVSSRLNPNFFDSSSYKEKKPLFNDSNSSKEKSLNNSLLLNNLVKQTSDSPSSSNKERKPSINNLHTSLSSLSKERKPSGTDSNSSTSLNNKDRKYSPTNSSSFPTFINKERKTIPTDTSLSHLSNHKEKLKINSVPSQIPTKRHLFTDSSPSHSPCKQIKVSHTKTNSNSKHFTSLSPDKKHSTHSDKYKRKESFTSSASPTDKIFTSSPKDQQTQVKKKKEKLFAQLFGDDSDSEIETEKKPIQMLKYPSSSSLTTENARKSPQKSKSGASFKKSSSSKIQSNHLENYFTSPNKESPKDDLIVIDNYTVSSDRVSQSPASQTMVACPVCQKKVPEITVNNHLDECLNMNLINENT